MKKRLEAHSEFLMTLVLFIAFRLLLLILFSSFSFLTSGFQGHGYYFEMASYSDKGQYPFVHFWFEYPPVFPYIAIAIYKLTVLGKEGFEYFNRVLTLATLPFDVLMLVNVYRIARYVYTPQVATRLGWIYSLLIMPAYHAWHGPDPILVALTLQSLDWLLRGRQSASAVALALAIATKFTPVFLLGTAWRFLTKRQAVIYTAILVAIVCLIFAPFLILSPTFTLASFQSLVAVSSWATIWALLDGNFAYGNVGTMPRHFDPVQAGIPIDNPALIPGWLTILIFGVFFVFVFTRPLDRNNPRHCLVYTGSILSLFLLWSKGWSPGWATLVLPLWLLIYPNWRGVLLVLVLCFASLLDWPLTLSLSSPILYIVGVLIRAALFVLVAVDLLSELNRRAPVSGQMVE